MVPYLVSGEIPLAKQVIYIGAEEEPDVWLAGDKYQTRENYTLYRCGHFKNKLFCDSTHLKVNFNGTEIASRAPYLEQAKEIQDPHLKLTYVEGLYASTPFCHPAGGIWNFVPKSDNPKNKRIAIQQAGNCPSGRLMVWDRKTGKAIEPVPRAGFEPATARSSAECSPRLSYLGSSSTNHVP